MTLNEVDVEIAQQSYRCRLELFYAKRHNDMMQSMEIFV
jgi:hypothetical protein